MRGFLRDPLFWLRETLRWHWREVIGLTAATGTTMALALALLST